MNLERKQRKEIRRKDFGEHLRSISNEVLALQLHLETFFLIETLMDNIAESYNSFYSLAFLGEPGAGKKTILSNFLYFLTTYSKLKEQILISKKRNWDSLSPINKERWEAQGYDPSNHEVVPVVFRFTMGILIAKAMELVEETKKIPDYDDSDLSKISFILSLVTSYLSEILPRRFPNRTYVAVYSLVGIDPYRDVGTSTLRTLAKSRNAYAVVITGDPAIREKALTERGMLKSEVEEKRGDTQITELPSGTKLSTQISTTEAFLYAAPPETMDTIRSAILAELRHFYSQPTHYREDIFEVPNRLQEFFGYYFMTHLVELGFAEESIALSENKRVESSGDVESKQESSVTFYNSFERDFSALKMFFPYFADAGNQVRREYGLSPMSEDEVKQKLDRLLLNYVTKSPD